MSQASTLERQMLDLINAERATLKLAPVRLELRLNDAAEDHSEWMLNRDIFSHTGVGGSSPGDRMRDAGFQFSGSWTWAENIAWQSERGAPGLSDDVIDLHNSLMNSPGHRANIENPDVEVIGIGIEQGSYNGWDAVMVTQKFARTSADVQFDLGNSTPAGATAGNDVLALSSPGQLNGLAGDDRLTGSAGRDEINGNAGADTLLGGDGDDRLSGSGGNDQVLGQSGADTISGGSGNDTLDGGSGDDKLVGNRGHDELWGASGKDTLVGGDGNDTLGGSSGVDHLSGGAGDDVLYGGINSDRFYGGSGNDRIEAGAGNDRALGGDGADRIFGGGGRDRLDGDAGNDLLTGGAGADIFVFSEGRDRITDFEAAGSRDRIDLRGAIGVDGFADLQANHLSQSGTDAVITDAAGHRLTLDNIQLAELESTDFLF